MKNRLIAFATVLVAMMMIAGAAIAGIGPTPSTTDGQELFNFADGSDAGDGVSHLTRTSGEALIVVEAEGLNAGEVHTLWWIVFNNPTACSDNVCGEDDIFLESGDLNVDQVVAARIAIGNATGNVAKSDGTIELGARLSAHDLADAQVDVGHQILFVPSDFGGVGNNLLTVDPDDAEIHVIVQGHGHARGGPQMLKQLSEVDYGCTPNCVDLQAAVHAP